MSGSSSREVEGHRAFRAALLALAYPGRERNVPRPRDDGRSAAAFLAQACDLPCLSGGLSAELVAALPVGTEECPELGATLVIDCGTAAGTTRALLSGPGIEHPFEAELPLDAAALAARNAACAGYPLGIDFLLVAAGGACIGLPRTTRVEIR
jgi:alpha-D-ribose 1-methylphosphonate 5-triphosphate synthase subunit PhnH